LNDDKNKHVFRVSKQFMIIKRNAMGAICASYGAGKLVVEEDKLLKVWIANFDPLSNRELA